MGASYVWPVSLPQAVRLDFSQKSGVRVLRTAMDAGTPKQRYVGKKADVMQVSFFVSDAQMETFERFVKETIKGVGRFIFPHPRTRNPVEVRIVPSGEGEMYSYAYSTPGEWVVSMTLEVMP